MKYDIDDIILRVEESKKRFLTAMISAVAVVVAAILVAIYYNDTTVVFVSAVAILATVIFVVKYIKKNNPLVIFSRGFVGANVKEHEYVTGGTRLYKYGGIRYRYNPQRHKGDVYIRRDDGEVVVVSCLPKKHLDIFEIGDTLRCYPGTRYPVVEGRDVEEQPCPICGFVNQNEEEKCESCGLKIVQNVK